MGYEEIMTSRVKRDEERSEHIAKKVFAERECECTQEIKAMVVASTKNDNV